MPIVKLQSSDGEVFDVDVEVAKRSEILKNMLEDLCWKEGDDTIPLPNIKGTVLKKILEWCTYHKDHPKDVFYDEDGELIELGEWDKEFFTVSRDDLVEFIKAANYLDIEELLKITTKLLAGLIKGKTPEMLRKMFNLPSLSEEEVELISKANIQTV